jgi:hypothetical protein
LSIELNCEAGVTTTQLPAARPTATLLVVSAAAFLASLDLFVVNIAFPDIRQAFGTPARAVSTRRGPWGPGLLLDGHGPGHDEQQVGQAVEVADDLRAQIVDGYRTPLRPATDGAGHVELRRG